MSTAHERIYVEVRDYYADAARTADSGAAACCGPDESKWGIAHYDDLGDLPDAVALASLGCGNPTAVADLHDGETVLDLARRNATEAGATNVEFLEGRMEAIPLPDASVDVVISNCVINLSPDKPAVFAEMQRVLRPGGRIGISDVVTEDRLTETERIERGSYVGCIAGALPLSEYEQGLRVSGFVDISITFTNEVGDGVHSAIVKATKPAS